MTVRKIIFLSIFFLNSLYALSDIDSKIGSMFMVGFFGTSVNANSQICKDIQTYNIAGVILFDYNPVDKTKPKNISSANQVKQLTSQLKACAKDRKLLIAVDQEGGRVQRFKSDYGFYGKFPSAQTVSGMSDDAKLATYDKMAKELKSVGINYDLAPVVDLAINPNNKVIVGLGRSYGKDASVVSKDAKIFINAMKQNGILTSLKHFPGHGSSLGDTHKGYVDVTKTWNSIELQPYKNLVKSADSVMVAHVFNANIDANYPASLSLKTINGVLRKQIGYRGVVITDDLQMGAVSTKYSLRDTIKLGINAGDDILLFGNQLDPKTTVSVKQLVDTVKSLLKTGEVDQEEIDEASVRVKKFKANL